MAALYLTIWVSLALFTAGQLGRAGRQAGAGAPAWAWAAFTSGLVLALVHTLLAFALVHGWSHDDAVRNTAAQTSAVFGVGFGAGVYVNYVFFAVWLADAVWWRLAPRGYVRPSAAAWLLGGFYLVILLNAAVIFAAGWRRFAGAAVVAALLISWWRGRKREGASAPVSPL